MSPAGMPICQPVPRALWWGHGTPLSQSAQRRLDRGWRVGMGQAKYSPSYRLALVKPEW